MQSLIEDIGRFLRAGNPLRKTREDEVLAMQSKDQQHGVGKVRRQPPSFLIVELVER